MKHNLGHLQNKHEDIIPLDVFIEGLVRLGQPLSLMNMNAHVKYYTKLATSAKITLPLNCNLSTWGVWVYYATQFQRKTLRNKLFKNFSSESIEVVKKWQINTDQFLASVLRSHGRPEFPNSTTMSKQQNLLFQKKHSQTFSGVYQIILLKWDSERCWIIIPNPLYLQVIYMVTQMELAKNYENPWR